MPFQIEKHLVLENSNLGNKIEQLFEELSNNKRLEHVFSKDPAYVLAKKVLPASYSQLTKQSLSKANRLLYSILSNKKFKKWLDDYQKTLEKNYKKTNEIDKQQIKKDLAEGLIRHGDQEIIYSLLGEIDKNSSLSTFDMRQRMDVAVEIETFAYAVAVAAVFVVVVAAVGVAPEANTLARVNKAELRGIVNTMVKRAEELKKNGSLLENKFIY